MKERRVTAKKEVEEAEYQQQFKYTTGELPYVQKVTVSEEQWEK